MMMIIVMTVVLNVVPICLGAHSGAKFTVAIVRWMRMRATGHQEQVNLLTTF